MKLKKLENELIKIGRWIEKTEESLATVKEITKSLLQDVRKEISKKK